MNIVTGGLLSGMHPGTSHGAFASPDLKLLGPIDGAKPLMIENNAFALQQDVNSAPTESWSLRWSGPHLNRTGGIA